MAITELQLCESGKAHAVGISGVKSQRGAKRFSTESRGFTESDLTNNDRISLKGDWSWCSHGNNN